MARALSWPARSQPARGPDDVRGARRLGLSLARPELDAWRVCARASLRRRFGRFPLRRETEQLALFVGGTILDEDFQRRGERRIAGEAGGRTPPLARRHSCARG